MRTNHLTQILIVCFVLPAAVFGAYAHTETWDGGDLAGWTGNTIDAVVSYSATGGNPNGYVYCTYTGNSGQNYPIGTMTEQDSFTGDLSGITSVSVDLYFERGVYSSALLRFRYQDATYNGWHYSLTSDFTVQTWQTYTVDFDPTWSDVEAAAAGWVQEDAGLSFQDTMADVYTTEIRISGSSLIAGVDNFTMVPEPASLSLLALGTIALIKRRK